MRKRKTLKRTRRVELTVMGLRYRVNRQARDFLSRYTPIPVELEREPGNAKDSNAIRVHIGRNFTLKKYRGLHIGYLRALVAEEFAPAIDSGAIVFSECYLTAIDGDESEMEALMTRRLGKKVKIPLDKSNGY